MHGLNCSVKGTNQVRGFFVPFKYTASPTSLTKWQHMLRVPFHQRKCSILPSLSLSLAAILEFLQAAIVVLNACSKLKESTLQTQVRVCVTNNTFIPVPRIVEKCSSKFIWKQRPCSFDYQWEVHHAKGFNLIRQASNEAKKGKTNRIVQK